jgi:hypothetical protein
MASDHAQHHADDERGHQRKAKGEARLLDCDVAGSRPSPSPWIKGQATPATGRTSPKMISVSKTSRSRLRPGVGQPMPAAASPGLPLQAGYGPRDAARLANETSPGEACLSSSPASPWLARFSSTPRRAGREAKCPLRGHKATSPQLSVRSAPLTGRRAFLSTRPGRFAGGKSAAAVG